MGSSQYSKEKTDEELLFNPRCKVLRCVTTNEIFSYIAEGADAYKIDSSGLAKHCKGTNGTKYCGKHPITNEKLVWEYVTNLKEISNNG